MARTKKASKAAKKKATTKSASGSASGSAKKPAGKAAKKSKTTKKAAPASKSASGSDKKSAKSSQSKSQSGKSSSRKKTAAKKSTGTSTKSTNDRAAAKKATTNRSKKSRSPFDSRFLEKMRKSLSSERQVYERQASQLRAEADSLVADLDPGDVQFDEESGEGDTIAVERGRDLALAAKALEMIEEIDHALAKFDDGTYGICEISGEPIPKERLEAIPWARERVEYKVGGFGRR